MSPRKPAKKKKAVSKPSKDSSRGRKTLGVVLVGIDKEGIRIRLPDEDGYNEVLLDPDVAMKIAENLIDKAEEFDALSNPMRAGQCVVCGAISTHQACGSQREFCAGHACPNCRPLPKPLQLN